MPEWKIKSQSCENSFCEKWMPPYDKRKHVVETERSELNVPLFENQTVILEHWLLAASSGKIYVSKRSLKHGSNREELLPRYSEHFEDCDTNDKFLDVDEHQEGIIVFDDLLDYNKKCNHYPLFEVHTKIHVLFLNLVLIYQKEHLEVTATKNILNQLYKLWKTFIKTLLALIWVSKKLGSFVK